MAFKCVYLKDNTFSMGFNSEDLESQAISIRHSGNLEDQIFPMEFKCGDLEGKIFR